MDIVQAVGDSMGCRVESADRVSQRITLSRSRNPIVGQSSNSQIGVAVAQDARSLGVSVSVQGAGRAGSREQAEEIFRDFRTRVLALIGSR
jgi:3-oxoacyl-ACP reductase-like protein